MANEIQVTVGLRVAKGNLLYQPPPSKFRADMAGYKGPTPSSITVPTEGLDITFSELNVAGGVCRLVNNDEDNYITIGIRDLTTDTFYPLLELLPGESYAVRLSRLLGLELGTGSGTGTTGSNSVFHIKADIAACDALVDAFDG